MRPGRGDPHESRGLAGTPGAGWIRESTWNVRPPRLRRATRYIQRYREDDTPLARLICDRADLSLDENTVTSNRRERRLSTFGSTGRRRRDHWTTRPMIHKSRIDPSSAYRKICMACVGGPHVGVRTSTFHTRVRSATLAGLRQCRRATSSPLAHTRACSASSAAREEITSKEPSHRPTGRPREWKVSRPTAFCPRKTASVPQRSVCNDMAKCAKSCTRANHKRNQSASTSADEASADNAGTLSCYLASHLHLFPVRCKDCWALPVVPLNTVASCGCNPNNLADELR